MLRTQVIGAGSLIIGAVTYAKFPPHVHGLYSAGATLLLIIGLFLSWNGYIANYNNDPDFAIFG